MASEVARIVALVCLLRAALGAGESELEEHHPTILVENIRRQLMNENYDYMPSESEEMFPPMKHELSEEPVSPTADRRSGTLDLDSDINDNFIQHTTNDHVIQKEKGINDKSHAISKKDLLYYLDDDRLKQDAEDVAAAVESTTTTFEESTTPNVTYKVLKVKDPHPSRRSQAFKRFIQEEGKDGVVIINLNEEPFPEFRLPRARRQYMMDQHDRDSEMEIAGPSEEG